VNALRRRSWSPYVVGALIGVVSWFAFASAGKPISITSAFENTAALAIRSVSLDATNTNSYYQAPEKSPKIDWEWALVIGVFVGAFLSAKLSGDRTSESVPDLWRRRFGSSSAMRFGGAFLGGAVMMFGARLAQGCTSGHGISGALQLAVSSWIFAAILFGSAILFSLILYGRERGRHV
jgi:uncharacterized protein